VIAWIVETALVNQDASVVRSSGEPKAEWAKEVGEPRPIVDDDQHSAVLVCKQCENDSDVNSAPVCPELFGHPEVAHTEGSPGESFGGEFDLVCVCLCSAGHQYSS
jgi:hypothetical protein